MNHIRLATKFFLSAFAAGKVLEGTWIGHFNGKDLTGLKQKGSGTVCADGKFFLAPAL